MSRPIFEPSLQRTDARLGFTGNQLQRRPAPTASASETFIEIFGCYSQTNLGTSETPLDWTEDSSSFDPGPPTFEINGDGNLQIFKDGLYRIEIFETTFVVQANVSTVSFIRVRKISGENANLPGEPGTFFNAAAGLYAINLLRADDGAGGDIDTGALMPTPAWSATLWFSPGTFGPGTAGPCEIEVAAYHEENQVGVATSFPDFAMSCTRIGSLTDW